MLGKIIAFEGVKGSGKSTLVDLFVQKFPTWKKVKEPQIFAKQITAETSDQAAAMLFTIDRYNYYRSTVLPLLEQGHNVIYDRYKLSTMAYQRPAGVSWIRNVNKIVPDPAMFIFIHLYWTLAEKRVMARDGIVDHDLMLKAYSGYNDAIWFNKKYFKIKEVDGSKPVEEVLEDIIKVL